MEWQKFETAVGSPLYVCEMPHAQSIASAVLIRVGTRDEKWPEEAGIAHALEHMMFHGAGQFPNSEALALTIEKTGGELNAWTSEEAVAYWNRVPSGCAEISLSVLSAQVYHPRILKKKIGTEIENIIEEIKMYKDAPSNWVVRLFIKALYGNHALGKDPLGTEEVLRSFTRDDFLSFHRRFYHDRNFTFAVVGAIQSKSARELFDTYFTGATPFAGRVLTERTTEAADITSIPYIVEEREIEQANVVVGWAMPPASSRQTKILQIFCDMIDGGMGFPLYQEVRGKLGLCYSVGAGIAPHTDASDFDIYIGTDVGRVEEALSAIHRVIKKYKTSQKFLRMVQGMISGRIRLQSEVAAGMLMRALMDIGSGEEPKSLAAELEEIKSVDIEEVEGVVSDYLTEDRVVQAMILPRK